MVCFHQNYGNRKEKKNTVDGIKICKKITLDDFKRITYYQTI